MINRVCLIGVLLVGLFIIFPGTVSAATTGDIIGVVDSQAVVTQHPRFEGAMRELQTISRRKEEEARAAAERETDDARRAHVIREKRMELAREEQRIMEPIIQQAQHAVRTVARTRGLTIVLERASVYVGGVDITEDVIRQLTMDNLRGTP